MLLLHMMKPVCFDLKAGKFWKGTKDPFAAAAQSGAQSVCDLKDVYALQLVSERVKNSGSTGKSYTSFELNLVLGDGSRINVMDHGSLDGIRSDAETLSETLGLPVWDGSFAPF